MTALLAEAPLGAQPKDGFHYEPRGGGRQVWAAHDREVVTDGPAGTGKSRACLEKLHLIALKYPGMRGLIVRKTRASLTQSALVTFEKKVLPQGSPIRLHHESQEYRYPNGSVLVVGGLGNLDEKTRVMSTEYDVIYLQEAREAAEGEWEDLTTRLRNAKVPYQQILGDTNPDAPTHWIKLRANRKALRLIPSRHEDNPTVTPEYLATLDALTGVRLKRLRHGLWVAAEGAIYGDVWDVARHLVDAFTIPHEWPRSLAIDFGFTNPFVCQWWAMDPDGRLYRYREIYRSLTLVEDHAHEIRRLHANEPIPQAIVCDHDAEDRATLERHLTCACVPYPKLQRGTVAARKDVSVGIQAMAQRLRGAKDGKPRMSFLRDALVQRDPILEERKLPACTEEEVESYVWATAPKAVNPDGEAKKEEPLKMNDHGCLIAGTLVATANGAVPIESIRPGMEVQTRSGLRRVVAAGLSEIAARVCRVRFTNGSELIGTGNHPVWVEGRGWSAVDALRYNDTVCTSTTGTAQGSPQPRTTRGARCASGVTTPTARVTRFTEHGALLSATVGATASWHSWQTWESGQSGPHSTGPIRQVTTSQAIAGGPRRLSNSRTAGSMPSPIWQRSAHWPARGMAARKGAAGTLSTLGRLGSDTSKRTQGRATSVVRNTPQQIPTLASAETRARRVSATRAAWTTSSERAKGAARHSWQTTIHLPVPARVSVLGRSGAGRADVYNLTVEGAPEYFANGVLVHNCDTARYLTMHHDWQHPLSALAGAKPVPHDYPAPKQPSPLLATLPGYYPRQPGTPSQEQIEARLRELEAKLGMPA